MPPPPPPPSPNTIHTNLPVMGRGLLVIDDNHLYSDGVGAAPMHDGFSGRIAPLLGPSSGPLRISAQGLPAAIALAYVSISIKLSCPFSIPVRPHQQPYFSSDIAQSPVCPSV